MTSVRHSWSTIVSTQRMTLTCWQIGSTNPPPTLPACTVDQAVQRGKLDNWKSKELACHLSWRSSLTYNWTPLSRSRKTISNWHHSWCNWLIKKSTVDQWGSLLSSLGCLDSTLTGKLCIPRLPCSERSEIEHLVPMGYSQSKWASSDSNPRSTSTLSLWSALSLMSRL